MIKATEPKAASLNLIKENGTEVNDQELDQGERTCHKAKILYPTKTLKGGIFRTELKVWIRIFAP